MTAASGTRCSPSFRGVGKTSAADFYFSREARNRSFCGKDASRCRNRDLRYSLRRCIGIFRRRPSLADLEIR
ncbi:hypothetical protein F2Q69_00002340 [Brassica cretica]|uniref:Uncharacterized protein n=1 Tax=Brassica cretica TaxID=69181 RepID=A0A8S9NYF8_BRACR|nr:hypothetical protein F2Q69_00002340 [Brassica cretica]